MVNMTHRPNVHMRLVALELLLAHDSLDSNVVLSDGCSSGWWIVKELVT
jgi:hypothetical protein